jgi:Ankyrin repeats (3 copies)
VKRLARSAASLLAAAGLLANSGCAPRLTAIGEQWAVDEAPPGKPWARLYHLSDGKRVVVDRDIEAYRLYVPWCLIYQAPRSEGHLLFVVAGRATPIAFRKNAPPGRWRLDADGPRRFEDPVDRDGKRLLTVEWINFGDACYVAQAQPPFSDDSARHAPFRPDSVKSESSTLDCDGADSVGNSTVSAAARAGQVMLVDELLRCGADPNAANDGGVSALMVARSAEVARLLIKAGARVDALDGSGRTALMFAVRYNNPALARVLLEAGAKPGIRDDMGRSAASEISNSDTAAARELRALLEGAK